MRKDAEEDGKNHALAATLGEKHSRRMCGDNALSSSAALIFYKLVANPADNFAMKGRRRGRQFKSTLLHHSVSRFSYFSENRSKCARRRAICERARTRRAPWSAQIGRIAQNLSGRDFARSVEIRRKFAKPFDPPFRRSRHCAHLAAAVASSIFA